MGIGVAAFVEDRFERPDNGAFHYPTLGGFAVYVGILKSDPTEVTKVVPQTPSPTNCSP